MAKSRFDMMAILLSRLDDHPTNQGQFEVIFHSCPVASSFELQKGLTFLQVTASRCLEIWAVHQPGGEDLNLRIQVEQGLVRNCPLFVSLIAGGGGGAALWEAVEDGGDWEVQGHQAHLQRPQHHAGNKLHSFSCFVHRECRCSSRQERSWEWGGWKSWRLPRPLTSFQAWDRGSSWQLRGWFQLFLSMIWPWLTWILGRQGSCRYPEILYWRRCIQTALLICLWPRICSTKFVCCRYSRQKLFPCCQAIHPHW